MLIWCLDDQKHYLIQTQYSREKDHLLVAVISLRYPLGNYVLVEQQLKKNTKISGDRNAPYAMHVIFALICIFC